MFFQNMDINITSIMIKGIPTIDSLSDTEDIAMPAGKGLQIVMSAVQMLLNRPKADQASDNQSTQQQIQQ
jgi:hypothetical protein